MDEGRWRSWAWRARSWAVSAYLVVHLAATVVWVLPPCPVRAAALPVARYYMMPLGFWQYWGMFAPDPVRDSFTLEADVVDARGLRATFAFPTLADYSTWAGIPRFRYSKYAANLLIPDVEIDRAIAARHAVRQLGIPDEAFPVDVTLVYQVRPTPPPGGLPADPMTPKQPQVAGTFHFDRPAEVRR